MSCPDCGFDPTAWRRRDLRDFFEGLGFWWIQATAGSVEDGPGRSVAGLAEEVAARLAVLAAGPGQPGSSRESRSDVLAVIERAGAAAGGVVASRPDGPAEPGGPDEPFIAGVHGLSHLLAEASHRLYPGSGVGPANPAGRIDQINVSLGGVPKRPVSHADVGFAGVSGDKQADRKHHGRPFQAVCLWSTEVIAGLAAAGHPIFAGAAGENLTVSGLDWPTMRPGTRLVVGPTLELELSWPATPCRHQAQWFSDGDYKRIHEDRNLPLVRWYAWVRVPGPVEEGAAVTHDRSLWAAAAVAG